MAAHSDRGVLYSTLCPKFLHTNSTSHTSTFSAIAELIDNAYDPDVNANQFWIDKTVVKGQECLSFMDNGNGLDHKTMHKMLSFGYSDKTPVNGVAPIGIYGNGFKSGSMRLGKDAIVFSKSENTSCVGMLSQTYLKEISANQIIVPIVCFEHTESREQKHKASLQDILDYSPFRTQEELLTELSHISPSWSTEKTGTRIIIWNLRRTSAGQLELDFEKDRYDIRVPSDVYEGVGDSSQHSSMVLSYIPESIYSLRAYCRILYLKPRMQIIIRGQKVKTKLIAKSLALCRKDYYKPTFLNRRVAITFGYNTNSKDQYGIMMYHKNRLIKAYERVGCQIKANNQGVGVIGVIECNFLDPTHNKQSFNETDKYRKTINSLGIKLEEYWKEIQYSRNKDNPNNNTPVEDAEKRPDQNWVQCDSCLKWRKLPDGIDCSKLPEKWFCHMNPDPQFRTCQVEEEPEDSDNDQPSYCKTYKKQERLNKRQQEMKRQEAENVKRQQEMERLANLTRQNEALRKQLRQKASTPTTPRSRFNIHKSQQGGDVRVASSPLGSSTISQAACSPSRSSGLPVISAVCSLSPSCSPRMKRTLPVTPQETPKRLRKNGFSQDDDDDDIIMLENHSTPKPGFTLTKVKTEKEPNDTNVCVTLGCSDDAALDISSEANAAGTSSLRCNAVGADPPLMLTSITTQTESPKLKTEVEEQSQAKENLIARENRMDVCVCTTDQRKIKQEGEQSMHQEEHTLHNGVTDHAKSNKGAGPSCADAQEKKYSPPHLPNSTEANKQQDGLLVLMQKTTQERDFLKEKVNLLSCQLKEVQSRVLELSQTNVKKEFSHQTSQTVESEDTEEGKDYKCLFMKAKEKVDQLIKDKEALLTTAERMTSNVQAKEKEMDEIALQIDNLMRELDQRDKERDELRSQLNTVREERANLSTQCEELRLSLQQERENAQEGSTTPQGATDSNLDPEEEGRTAVSSSNSSSDTFRSLVELRQNVGRLLVNFVPALDSDQVNYECNVIDEILEQVLSSEDFLRTVGQIH